MYLKKQIRLFFCRGSLLLVFIITNACTTGWSPEEGFLIKGDISDLDHGWATLAKIDLLTNEKVVVDSAVIKGGQFSFRGKRDSPYMHTVFLNDTLGKIHLFLDNSRIEIKGSLQHPDQIKVTGSREDTLFRSYSLDAIFEQEAGMEIMLNYPGYTFSAFVAYYQFQIHQIDAPLMDSIVLGFSDSVKSSEYYNHLFSLYSVIKRVAVSQPAPDFALPDVNGDTIQLSDFRGAYVLLDFWASWCPPCRAANPDLVELYHHFKERGFTIIGISVDKSRERWLEAIEKDQLGWTNLSALDGWGSITQLYGVKAVPQSFLIDPQGIIIDKNLRHDELKGRLRAILPETD